MSREIQHEADSRRFALDVDGQTAYLLYRDLGDGVYEYASTFVPPTARGRGIGGRIVRHALDHAREQGWKVVPTCWFVREAIEREPEYRPLVAS